MNSFASCYDLFLFIYPSAHVFRLKNFVVRIEGGGKVGVAPFVRRVLCTVSCVDQREVCS